MFESLLCTTIGEEVPAVVFQSVGTFQAGITAEQVGVNAGVFRSVPVDIGTQVEVTALADVLIGRVEYVLTCFLSSERSGISSSDTRLVTDWMLLFVNE